MASLEMRRFSCLAAIIAVRNVTRFKFSRPKHDVEASGNGLVCVYL